MNKYYCILISLFIFCYSYTTIINIPADQPTIQAGIEVAVNDDTVLVQPGIYVENINFNGTNITVASLFMTTLDTIYISQTIIDGNQNGSVVKFESGEDSTGVLCGFTITNGFSEHGGGIYYYNSNPTLTNNIIGNNIAYNDAKGGGIYCYESNPTLTNNIISSNSAINNSDANGGGIYCYDSNPTLTNNIISNNIVESQHWSPKGGGIYCYNSNPMLTNNTISSNSANNNYDDAEGGGIYCSGSSSPTFMNNNIIGNSIFGANVNGGGIFLDGGSPTFIENVISNNTACGWSMYSNGGGICCHNANITITNNIISNNNAYTESQYGFSKGGGIYCKSGNLNITDGTIIGNTSSNEGGGIHCEDGSTPILINVTIHENTTSSYGGGIYCGKDSGPSLQNVVITDNYAFDCGGGIFCYFDSGPSLDNVTITGNYANRGGGINCSYNSEPDFNLENRCSIYLNNVINSRGYGADIFSVECDIINVIVDTFTVLTPTDYYASPIDNYNFDILYGIQDTLINSDLFVSVDGDDSNAGITADEPLKTIRYALSKIYADSINHNTIYLSAGIYSSETNGETFPIVWSNYVSLEGSVEEATILDADNVKLVMKFFYLTDVIISNITIRNGYGSYYGGGIYCYNSSPSLENITITDNSAPASGGGIFCWCNSNPILENVTITGNSANYNGGGICCYYNSNPSLTNVTITGNSASGSGGGIYCSSSSPSLENVTITGNSTSDNGGGIYCSSSSPSLENVTITGNSASDNGGGIYCRNFSNPSLMNCILWNDSPQEVYFHDYGNPTEITISYSDIQGGENGIVTNNNGTVNWLEGNIDADPLFVGTGEDPYSLLEDSPCIDAGIPDTTGLNLPLWDIIGNLRIWDGDGDGIAIIDMGAYEYGAPPYVDIDDNVIVQTPEVFLHQNYPNPFNPETNISYKLPVDSNVELIIYNIKGQMVKTLVDEQLQQGEYSAIWNSRDSNCKPVSSGLYFYKLKAGDFQKVKKMILIK